MPNTSKLLIAVSAMLLLALALAWAQPGRRSGGGSSGVTAEQILGYLALSPDIMLNDEQLLHARNALRGPYGRQMQLREEMRSPNTDRQAVQASLEELQRSMIGAASAVLTRQQSDRMKAAVEQMGGRRGSFRR